MAKAITLAVKFTSKDSASGAAGSFPAGGYAGGSRDGATLGASAGVLLVAAGAVKAIPLGDSSPVALGWRLAVADGEVLVGLDVSGTFYGFGGCVAVGDGGGVWLPSTLAGVLSVKNLGASQAALEFWLA